MLAVFLCVYWHVAVSLETGYLKASLCLAFVAVLGSLCQQVFLT